MNTKNDTLVEKARIVVVDDHAMVREGLVALINRTRDFTVCGEAESRASAVKVIAACKPDLVIVDLILSDGDGMELIRTVRASEPDLPFLVISMQDEEIYAERCLKAGAGGYIMKHAATEELMTAIHAVLDGDIFISRKMNVRLLMKLADPNQATAHQGLKSLTDRELQVYQMFGAAMTTREIASTLGISPKTIATHRENIKLKMGFKDSRALIHSAMQWQTHGGA